MIFLYVNGVNTAGDSMSSYTHGSTSMLASDVEASSIKQLKIVAYTNMAMCQLKMNAPEKAIDLCDKVLMIEPGHVKALFRKAQAYIYICKSVMFLSYWFVAMAQNINTHWLRKFSRKPSCWTPRTSVSAMNWNLCKSRLNYTQNMMRWRTSLPTFPIHPVAFTNKMTWYRVVTILFFFHVEVSCSIYIYIYYVVYNNIQVHSLDI